MDFGARFRPDIEGGDAAGLQSDDWRGGSAPGSGRARGSRQGVGSSANAALHLRERPGSLAVERARAREVIAAARDAVTTTFADIRFGRRINVADLEPVVAGIAASVARNATALPSVTRLKSQHEYTYLHSVAVCGLMIGLAGRLGLDPALTQEIGLAGLLHDIGKACVPVALLDKPGPLDIAEYAQVQQHAQRGHELLCEAGITDAIPLDVCLHHHERVDGKGYPSGLAYPELSIHARMAAVCDVYDAVTSTRSYKQRWSPGEALEWMAASSGHFDPHVLRLFRQMIGIFPLGSLVRLTSGRLVHHDAPSCPDVCVFIDALTGRQINRARYSTVHDPILGVESPERWAIRDWSALRDSILSEFED